jgi:anti-sigma B factor antagonist
VRPDLTVTDAPVEIRTTRVADAVVVRVAGEVDLASAPELGRALEAGFEGVRCVVVDLSGIGFLDSSVLDVLVRGQADLAAQGIEFRVVSPSDRAVRRVFEITRLNDVLGVVGSLDDALA